jgi:N-terminal domain of toast_rack, DUF2154/LiaI-LiaF-like transmembrane region
MPRDGRVRSTSVVFPLLLIAFGALLLLRRWYPFFDPWPILLKYWPLLLILIGAGMMWDRTQRRDDPEGAPAFPVGSTIGTIVFLLTMAVLIWHGRELYRRHNWIDSSVGASSSRQHESQSVELQGAKAARVVVHMPSGLLTIQDGAGQLLQADFYQGAAWSPPNLDYHVDNGFGTLTIDQQSASEFVGHTDNNWKLKLIDNVPLELEIDVGAGRSDLNLSKIDLTRLQLNIGAGQVNVDLTGERSKDLQAQLHGGVGEAIVRLPKNVGVVATAHGGLGSIDVHGLKEEDGQYVNAAYGHSPNTLRLTVEGGIGHIRLEQE